MSLFDLVNTLKNYSGAGAANPPANTEQDFQNAAQAAPQSHVADGLANVFRSGDQTGAGGFPQMISGMFGQSNGTQRAGILNMLMNSAGPSLAAGALGSGALSSLGGLLGGGGGQVTPEQAAQVQPQDVQQLAEHAQRHDPTIIDQASSFYAQHPTAVKALGAGALAMIMSHISQRQ